MIYQKKQTSAIWLAHMIRVRESPHSHMHILTSYIYIYIYIYTHTHTYTYILILYIYVYIYTYIYIYPDNIIYIYVHSAYLLFQESQLSGLFTLCLNPRRSLCLLIKEVSRVQQQLNLSLRLGALQSVPVSVSMCVLVKEVRGATPAREYDVL
jgi:hypothetical protein